ncbi:hypothetical protein MKY41_10535 [Sporosarcina sp. FSL W7-1349]|uniref:hypothetical protein n=1 Tax=Sporosarcina sp. FSL W7-1349 TaxID=2921561 RepID=UPI0030FC425A
MRDSKNAVETISKIIKNNEVMEMSKDVIQSDVNENQFGTQPVKTPLKINTIPYLTKQELTIPMQRDAG